jgi:hypothetical protein
MFVSGEELPQTHRESNGGDTPLGSRHRCLFAGLWRPVVPDPAGQAVFIDLARSDGEDHGGSTCGRYQEIDLVETQKYDERAKGCAFVAVDKRMVPGNAESAPLCKTYNTTSNFVQQMFYEPVEGVDQSAR